MSSDVIGNRVEQLANNFAGALLMPAGLLDQAGDWSSPAEEDLIARLNSVAEEFQVTSTALMWRLVALGKLKPAAARALPAAALRNNGRSIDDTDPPALFSELFMEVIGLAIDAGLVSVRRMARLLDLTVEELADVFATRMSSARKNVCFSAR